MRSSLQIVGRWWKFLLAGIGLAVVFGAPRLARHLMETRALTSGPNGSETPASLGVPFERVAIPSGVRRLDSYVVTADGACENPPVIVNYHGVQETISEWVKGGKRLCFVRSVAGTKGAFYRVLAYTIPDWWDNVKSVQEIRVPLLVVHSDADQVNPIDGGRKIFAAARQPKELAVLHGYRHNDLYQKPTEGWWSAVLVFINAP